MDISSLTVSPCDLAIDDVFVATALPSEKKTALEKLPVELTDGYELPREKIFENAPVLLKEVDGEAQAATGENAIAPVGLLMAKLSKGEAHILDGSTDEVLKIEVDGKVYFVVGRFAELVVDAALQVNGFFGHYVASHYFSGRSVIHLDDGSEDQRLDLDLDGAPLFRES